MRFKRRRPYDPMRDLIQKIRVAAAQINEANARRIAAREAVRIPLTQTEKAHGKRGDVARRARALMRALPDMDPANYDESRDALLGFVEALESRFEVTSETSLGRKGRSDHHAAA